MPALQISASQLSTTGDEDSPATMLIVAVANIARPEQGIEMEKCLSGQKLVDLFNEIDRPDSDKAIVGVLLAIPPKLNGSPRWVVENVFDFARVKLKGRGRFLWIHTHIDLLHKQCSGTTPRSTQRIFLTGGHSTKRPTRVATSTRNLSPINRGYPSS